MNEIDNLMDRLGPEPRGMSIPAIECTPDDITEIIVYERKHRILLESGKKPKKEAGPAPDVATLMSALGIGSKPKLVQPTGGSLRRL